MPRSLVVEADGGSRGNPGPAAFGSVVKDADTGAVLVERAESIGTATNNVAEYQGLIAGLRAAAEIGAIIFPPVPAFYRKPPRMGFLQQMQPASAGNRFGQPYVAL